MKVTGRIVNVAEPRRGVSAKTGNAWEITEITIKWMEVSSSGNPYQQQIVGRVMEPLNLELVNNAIQCGTEFDFYLNFQVEDYKGRMFNNIRINCKEILAQKQ